MKTIITVILLSAMALGLPAQNFTIKGHFTDVANDTLLIEYVKHEPEKEVVNESVPIDENGFLFTDATFSGRTMRNWPSGQAVTRHSSFSFRTNG